MVTGRALGATFGVLWWDTLKANGYNSACDILKRYLPLYEHRMRSAEVHRWRRLGVRKLIGV
jgi:hypothetical protein